MFGAPGSAGTMSAAANTIRRAEVEPAWASRLCQRQMTALLGEGAPLAEAVPTPP